MKEANDGVTKLQLLSMVVMGLLFNTIIFGVVYAVWKDFRVGVIVAVLAVIGFYASLKWLVWLDRNQER